MPSTQKRSQLPASAAKIVREFVSILPTTADEDEREFSYTDGWTQRQFKVRRSEGAEGYQFFLEELVPNGRVCRYDSTGGLVDCHDDSRIPDAEQRVGPNALLAEIAHLDIDANSLIFCGGGYCLGALYWKNLDECAEAIAAALRNNTRYKYWQPLSPEEKAAQDLLDRASSQAYWADEAATMTQAQQDKGLFKGCYTMLGLPLADDTKKLVLGYLNAPDQATWLDIRGYLIVGGISLWQAWCAAEPKAPKSGNVGFPEPEQLRQAIRQAVQDRQAQIQQKTGEAN